MHHDVRLRGLGVKTRARFELESSSRAELVWEHRLLMHGIVILAHVRVIVVTDLESPLGISPGRVGLLLSDSTFPWDVS